MRGVVLLGLAHFVTELGCSYSLTQTLDNSDLQRNGVLLFNALAFWAQPVFGWAVDRWRTARFAALIGGLLVVAAVLGSGASPWFSVALMGVGNACFHVGAGALCIAMSRGKAAGLGLFVGPGAFGLTLGVGLARTAVPFAPIGLAALIVSVIGCLCLIHVPSGAETLGRQSRSQPLSKVRFVVVITLVLGCIAIRSFVGLDSTFSWNMSAGTALSLALALSVGKMGGGFLADRFGWIAASVTALAFSAPLLWLGQTTVGAGLLGVALFQAPMAVTLGVLARLFPARPGFVFGVASAAVYGGAFLVTGEYPGWLHSFSGLNLLSFTAAIMLVFALRWLGLSCESATAKPKPAHSLR